jgi:hypothetical protein
VRFSFRSLKAAAYFFFISWLVGGCAGYSLQQAATTAQNGTLSLSTTSLNFKSVVIGQTATQTVQVSNGGRRPVSITALSVSDPQFSVAGATVPLTLQSGATVSLTVSFTPTTVAADSATLNVTSRTPVSPQLVTLSGSGEKAAANLVVSPPSINFGSQALKTIKSQTVTLQNTGDVSLTIQSVTGAGGGFSSNLAPGVSIAAGSQVTFQVAFDPTLAGPAAATLSFAGSNLASPGTLALSGTGANPSNPTPPPNPPAPPTPTAHKVDLNWDASKSQVIGYIVYRGETSGGPFNPLFGTATPNLSYQDASVSDSTTYYYVVTSVEADGTQSIHSNQVTVTIP